MNAICSEEKVLPVLEGTSTSQALAELKLPVLLFTHSERARACANEGLGETMW